MQNVEMKVVKNVLTLTIDLSKEFGRSKSGKTISIASTLGNQKISEEPETFVGVNVYRK